MLQICNGCTTAYSVGPKSCPECGCKDFHPDHEDAPVAPEPKPGTKAKTEEKEGS